MSTSWEYYYWMHQVLAICGTGENGTRGARFIFAQKLLSVDWEDKQKYCRECKGHCSLLAAFLQLLAGLGLDSSPTNVHSLHLFLQEAGC